VNDEGKIKKLYTTPLLQRALGGMMAELRAPAPPLIDVWPWRGILRRLKLSSRHERGLSMRAHKLNVIALIVLVSMWTAAQLGVASAADGDQYVGTWKGTWEGAGAGGRFDLSFARGSDGKLAASVSVGTDAGDYTAKFSTTTLTGDKLAGAYDYPPDPQGEVTVTGTFDPKTGTGTWSLGAKGQPGGQTIAGTWKVSK
jgi:hypothetical protein